MTKSAKWKPHKSIIGKCLFRLKPDNTHSHIGHEETQHSQHIATTVNLHQNYHQITPNLKFDTFYHSFSESWIITHLRNLASCPFCQDDPEASSAEIDEI